MFPRTTSELGVIMLDETLKSSGNSDISQKNLNVGGNNAGRDLIQVTIGTSTTDAKHPGAAFISRLAVKYREEKQRSAEFRETVERLEHYQTQAAGEPTFTLEQKLCQGNRADMIRFALKTKEMFAKKLAKHALFEAAQEIHAFLLAEVYTRYHECVYYHVCRKAAPEVINALIRTHIIDPLLGILGDNVLGHYADEINGMLYFLTGNCHIKWTD